MSLDGQNTDLDAARIFGLNPIEPDRERVVKAFPTLEMQKVYDLLGADTFPKEGAIIHKKEIALEVRERGLIDSNILRNFPTVYICSGIDFRYPIILGARNIEMVDSVLADPEIKTRLTAEILEIFPEAEITENRAVFRADFGEGEETVTINLHPEYYGARQDESSLQESAPGQADYSPYERSIPFAHEISSEHPEQINQQETERTYYDLPEKVGLILGFRTEHAQLDANPAIWDRIVPGGYMMADHAMESIISDVLTEDNLGEMIATPPEERTRQIDEAIRKRGFEQIELEAERDKPGDSSRFRYTFIHKLPETKE